LEFYLTHELIDLKVKTFHLPNDVLTMFVSFGVSLFASWIVAKLAEVCIGFGRIGMKKILQKQ
jgi:hypothetical protein